MNQSQVLTNKRTVTPVRRFDWHDPRPLQIAALCGLLLYGLSALDFTLSAALATTVIVTTLTVQWLGCRITGQAFDPLSPLISALSLCLLLRTNAIEWAATAAALAIASKFLLRVRGKHIFNPTNIALVTVLLVTDAVWVSPGQWGQAAWLALALACAGVTVLTRARRLDVCFAFLGMWTTVLIGRALWLGDPLAIAAHQLQTSTLLIFAFFMLPDPRSTPNSRAGRMLFAALVTVLGAALVFGAHTAEGLLYALAAAGLTTPALDRYLPGKRYAWAHARPRRDRKGDTP